MLPLETKASNFELLDTVSGQELTLENLKGTKGTMIMFICNHCPFVIHVKKELVSIANQYLPEGIGFIAISSNDIENYPQDAPDKMAVEAKENRYPFPYLFDETQEIAKAYNTACTPDLYLFDKDLKLVYRGQLDSSRPGNEIPVTGEDLRHAIDCLLQDKENTRPQKPSIGCNIKWKN